ncbi:MAG TPA: VWA domain-containing protein [Pyrinomonadaceae bacterium]|jgi:Ca-activated chloride channel homolog
MKCLVVCFFLVLSLVPAVALAQTKTQSVKRGTTQSPTFNGGTSRRGTVKICQGIPIPEGYIIVAYGTSTACKDSTYVLKREDAESKFSEAANRTIPQSDRTTAVSRARRVSNALSGSVPPRDGSTSNPRQPTPQASLSATPLDLPINASARTVSATSLDKTKEEEVGPGDVVRIDTNLVTVPVSVLDRHGRLISDLRREQFSVFENGVEQQIAYFEPTEKPFTVALLLDTSGSTFFHLWEIKEAAIAFAKQLRPQDRVLVVTFDRLVLLLTEATNDLNVVTDVIERNAMTGLSTRLYDAIDLVIKRRLNKIQGRKAIVVFTDGVDTASYGATYKSTLLEAEESDLLIYPIQYDTTDFIAATQDPTDLTMSHNWPSPARRPSQLLQGLSSSPIQLTGSTTADYKLADQYLHQLADKTGARLYQANDRTQLAKAFSKIAEELRYQYSLGYYPQTSPKGAERRFIKVRLDRLDLDVRARESYVQRDSIKARQ